MSNLSHDTESDLRAAEEGERSLSLTSQDEPRSPRELPCNRHEARRGSNGSLSETLEAFRASSEKLKGHTEKVEKVLRGQTEIKDESESLSLGIICLAIGVAIFCGVAAFLLHMAVQLSGCFGGVNGCHHHILLDAVEPLGVGKSVFFVITSSLSGLCASLIIYSPFKRNVALKCKGGGSAGTKIVISAGQSVSGWVPLLRIILAAVYLGGGNTLGTEGPIIHLAASLATWLISLAGLRRHKTLSMFAVIGAAAGISAGFNVLITGFIFVIEELTRSLSQKSALIITLAAGVAIFVKDVLEYDVLEHFIHMEHPHLVPDHDNWDKLSKKDLRILLLTCIPIGALSGVLGWVFARATWAVQVFLNPRMIGKPRSTFHKRFFPEWSHLAVIGLFTGCLGALVYEVTGVNGVWGTTVGAIPEMIEKDISWDEALLLFGGKLCATILATAGGGPGGTLVPSLAAGGSLGIAIGRLIGLSTPMTSACAVIGMGSFFASVMHMPLTGVIIIFELTWAESLILHVVFANFIASNIVTRLPLGHLSYVHRCLHHDPVWKKLGGHDFIETDEHEQAAISNAGVGQVMKFKCKTLKAWFMTNEQMQRLVLKSWRDLASATDAKSRRELSSFSQSHQKYLGMMLESANEGSLRLAWTIWVADYMQNLRLKLNKLRAGRKITPESYTLLSAQDAPLQTISGKAGAPFKIAEDLSRLRRISTQSELLDWPGPTEQPIHKPERKRPLMQDGCLGASGLACTISTRCLHGQHAHS